MLGRTQRKFCSAKCRIMAEDVLAPLTLKITPFSKTASIFFLIIGCIDTYIFGQTTHSCITVLFDSYQQCVIPIELCQTSYIPNPCEFFLRVFLVIHSQILLISPQRKRRSCYFCYETKLFSFAIPVIMIFKMLLIICHYMPLINHSLRNFCYSSS